MAKFLNILNPLDTTGFIFVMPSVSVGNVGQLTVDLLIPSNDMQKFATVWHPGIIPAVGGNPFTGDSSDVCLACELYVSVNLKAVVMQLRSSIEYELAESFFDELKQCVLDLKFSKVIILTSSFAFEMHNVESSLFRYVTNDDEVETTLKQMQIPAMEVDVNGKYVIHGSGFACILYELFKECSKCTIMIKYSSEGDNRPDALQMLNVLYQVVTNFHNLNSNDTKFPKSWDFVFGNLPPIGIY